VDVFAVFWSPSLAGIPFPTRRSLDPQGNYLTFTLSDGDQWMMMHSGELGNWYSSQRGRIAFNWVTQPLLAELASALMEKYNTTATENDCLIAGPSGAGYIVPPLAPHLGIRFFYAIVPGIVFMVALPLLIWYPITREKHAEMVKQSSSQEIE